MRSLLSGKYLILTFSILLAACDLGGQGDLKSAGLMTGLASPIELQPESTIVELSDWVIQTDKIDSITVSAGLELKIEETRATISGVLQDPLGNISIWSTGKKDDILLTRSNKTVQTITYKGKGNDVRTKGEFNAWNTSDGKFEKLEDGSFVFKKHLNPGRYQYILVVDGKEMLDPSNPDSVDNGQGGWNSLLVSSGSKPSTLPRINGSRYDENKIHFQSNNLIQGAFCYFNNTLLGPEYVEINNQSVTIQIPKEALELERSFIRLWAYNRYGISNDVLIPVHKGRVLSDTKLITRQDKEGLVMYFLMLDRFNNGNFSNDRPVNDSGIHPKANYHGGDIAGITNKLDDAYFKELGINTLWLSPIAQNPETAYGKYPSPSTTFSGYHGYWPISSSKIDDRYGTSRELQELVNTAHEKDINVILDYVANHVHEDHPVYQQHPEWATSLYLPDGTLNTRKWDEHRLTTWFDTFLPTLDLSKLEVVGPMTDSALFWLEKYNLDGFRHDATKHIPLVFWRELTKKIKKNSPKNKGRVLQIGETYGSRELIKSYIGTGMLDGQFDFNLYDDAVATFARDDVGFDRLANSLRESLNYYGDHNLMGYITGNQDRARFISYADGSIRFDEDAKLAGWTRYIEIQDTVAYDKLASLTAFMMAIPGIPVIYYGDEIGLPGGNDPDNRRMMQFEKLSDHQQRHFTKIKQLINFRRSNLPLIYGDTRILTESDELLVLERRYFTERVLCLFNKGNMEARLTNEELGIDNQVYSTLDQGSSIQGVITIPPYSYQFIKMN